ncbi:MAG: DUF1361 domain-containing protein [Cyanobacteria bacterium REEB459]|nr:DUF1361 domain-containing protein [Cyanobacteria bacterium REEB459]
MALLYQDIVIALNNTYSGWILWNLFLALIPLLLSFRLFRPQALPKPWFRAICGIVGLVGLSGIWSRLPWIVHNWISLVVEASTGNSRALLRLGWLVLAAGFALGLGRSGFGSREGRRAWGWGLGVGVFMAFLPNAPYLLTDIIHLIRGLSSGQVATWVAALIFVPLHIAAILVGFEAYVLSILNLAFYLKQHGARAWILPTELLIHAFCALGIYLGRFIRLNSWDLVTAPLDVLTQTLNLLSSKRPLLVIILTFLILTGLYWLMKQVTLGLKLRLDYARQGLEALD